MAKATQLAILSPLYIFMLQIKIILIIFLQNQGLADLVLLKFDLSNVTALNAVCIFAKEVLCTHMSLQIRSCLA